MPEEQLELFDSFEDFAGSEGLDHQSEEVRRMNDASRDPSLFGGIRRMFATGGVFRAELQTRLEAVRFTGTIQVSLDSGHLSRVEYDESFGITGQGRRPERTPAQ